MSGHLSRSVFLPVDRRDILHVLTHMDAIADNAEDVGVLLSLRWMEIPEEIKPDFLELLYASLKVARESSKVINSLGNLFDAGFSGPDAVTVMNLIDNIDKLEHSADKAQDRFGKALFRHEDDMKPAALFMWVKIANKVGDLANSAERMVNNIRTMLASK